MSASARSSVFVGASCNPAVTGAQEFPTSGFHARQTRNRYRILPPVRIASSTRAGVCLNSKTIPTVRVTHVADSAESSLRDASLARATRSILSLAAPFSNPPGVAFAAGVTAGGFSFR